MQGCAAPRPTGCHPSGCAGRQLCLSGVMGPLLGCGSAGPVGCRAVPGWTCLSFCWHGRRSPAPVGHSHGRPCSPNCGRRTRSYQATQPPPATRAAARGAQTPPTPCFLLCSYSVFWETLLVIENLLCVTFVEGHGGKPLDTQRTVKALTLQSLGTFSAWDASKGPLPRMVSH